MKMVENLLRRFSVLDRKLAAADELVLILDFDGTLSPLVEMPSAAVMPEGTRETLQALAVLDGITLVILSGRALEDLKSRAGVGGVIYGGCHGLEIEGEGICFRHPDLSSFEAVVDEIAETLSVSTEKMPGLIIENKRYALSVHYRKVDGEREEEALAAISQVAGRYPCRARISRESRTFEILPPIDWDKGKASLWILEALAKRASRSLVLCMGDELTDEDAFAALKGMAVTVMVNPLPSVKTCADFRLDNTDEVAEVLGRILHCVSGRSRKARLEVREESSSHKEKRLRNE